MTTISALKALGSATHGQIINNELLIASYQKMTPAQIASAAATSQLDYATLSATLKAAGFNQEQRNTIAGLFEEIKMKQAATAATGTYATATGGATAATGGLSAALKGLGTVIKTHPLMSFLTILSILLPVITSIADKVIVTTEELQEQVNTTVGEIDTLQGELTTTQSRIAELKEIGHLSTIEQEELNRLETENSYLEAQIKLLEEKKRLQATDYNDAATRDFKTKMNGFVDTGNSVVIGYDDGGNELYGNETRQQAYDRELAFLQNLQAEKAKYTAMSDEELLLHEAEIAALNEKERKAREFVTETAAIFTAYANSIVVVDEASEQARASAIAAAEAAAAALGNMPDSPAEDVVENVSAVVAAFNKLESVTKDRESITEVLDAFMTGTGDAKLAANMGKIIEAFPHLRDEIGLYSSGIITAEELQNEFNKALAGFDADNIYDGVNDIADAVETYGKDSYQVIQAVQDLEAAVPGLTGVLYDAETGMLKVDVAAYETEQSLYGVLKAAIKTEYEAKRLDLSNAITELEDLRDAAIETAAGLRNVENQRVYNAFASYTGDIDAKKAELEALTQWYNGILGELNAADGRYDRTTDAHKEAFEKEYDTHKHKVAMEQETEAEFYAWLEDANERYFANSKKYLGEYRKYKEEVFNGLREVMDDALADEEHQISLLDNAGGNKAEIVKHYRNMQDIVHQAADSIRADMRAAGMSEEEIANSDIIQDLQTKWWSYRDNIKDALSSIDKDLEEHLTFAEHEIYLLEQQEGHEDQIIAKYLQLQNKVHEAADEIRDDLRELGYTEEEIAKNGAVMELQKKWWEYNDAIKETVETLNEDMHDSLESLLDLTVEMIKQEKEDEKEVLEDLKDDYKDLIEARKKMLELTKKESEYTEDVEEKTRKLAKIEEKLAKLKLDDSRTARIEEEKLKEEQLELQKELNKIQREHYHDEAEAALDDELEMFEKTQDDKIDEIEDYLDAEGQLRQDALNKLSDMNETLYDQLTAYAKKYTDTSGMELQKMWDDALEAAQRYGDYTAALENTNKEIDMQNVYKESARVIINEMRTNAANWATASDPQALADRNMDLAEQLADAFKMAGVSATITRDHAGVWWINNEKLFEYKFHSGTASVGGKPSKKQNETFALLDNTEMVLTQKHQNNLWNMLSAWAPIASLKSSLSGLSIAGVTKTPAMAGGPNITIEAPLYLTGNVDDATLRAMKKYKNELSEMVSAQLKKL